MDEHLKQFITTCSITFKAFEHKVTITKNKANPWQFTTVNREGDKKYAVMCTPQHQKMKAVIKLATKKTPKGTRLVVVTTEHSEDERQAALKEGYCLVSLTTLKQFGDEMLEIKGQPKVESKKPTTKKARVLGKI